MNKLLSLLLALCIMFACAAAQDAALPEQPDMDYEGFLSFLREYGISMPLLRRDALAQYDGDWAQQYPDSPAKVQAGWIQDHVLYEWRASYEDKILEIYFTSGSLVPEWMTYTIAQGDITWGLTFSNEWNGGVKLTTRRNHRIIGSQECEADYPWPEWLLKELPVTNDIPPMDYEGYAALLQQLGVTLPMTYEDALAFGDDEVTLENGVSWFSWSNYDLFITHGRHTIVLRFSPSTVGPQSVEYRYEDDDDEWELIFDPEERVLVSISKAEADALYGGEEFDPEAYADLYPYPTWAK